MAVQHGKAIEPETRAQGIRTALVVDDSRMQRRILTSALKRFGLHVCEASSGVEALEICRSSPPDLVVSDWMMPEMNGLEFCKKFRDLPNSDYGYFILVTSKSEKAEIAHGLDAGADDFLTKPVNLGELRARISAGDRIICMQRELSEKNRLIHATLDELREVYDSIDNDLIEAKKLQQSLVSDRYRDFGSAEVSLMLRSSGHVGGDLVGFFQTRERRLGIYAIDVSGHGISSALMTARLAGYLSANSPDQNVALQRTENGMYVPRPPKQTVEDLNQLLLGEIETEHYFTMVLADVDLDTGQVTMTQAGHPNPLIQRANGDVEFVGTSGLPVGLIEDAGYDQFEVRLHPGDRLLLHSDGVGECAAPDGTLFGDEGLAVLVGELRSLHAQSFHETLVWKLSEYSGSAEFNDDISCVLLEFRQPGLAS
ncbi:MAG: SpoIIE family protein phosphatase [Pseudomonadota bacterium]